MASIAVIILDTLRKDAFDRHFDWLSGKTFENAYSTAHWTIPAHGSLFTGFYPSEIGVHAKSQTLDCPQPTIAETVSAAEYTTRFWCANGNLTVWDGWRRGFDEFYGPSQLNPEFEDSIDWVSYLGEINAHSSMKYPKAIWHAIRSNEPTIRAIRSGYRQLARSDADGGTIDVLKRAQQTKFGNEELLFINLMETHTPYYSPNRSGPIDVVIADAFNGNICNPNRIQQAYNTSAKVLSRRYKRLFDELRPEFDYIITLSDHGELLGEHEMWNHGYGLYPELVNIPLVVSGDSIEDTTVDRPVSLLDVHQTIATIAGVDTTSRGASLLDSIGTDEYLTEYEGFVPMHRAQFRRKGVSEAVYDRYDTPLRGVISCSGSYTYQRHGEELPPAASETLRGLSASIEERNPSSRHIELSDDIQKRLEDLGYA